MIVNKSTTMIPVSLALRYATVKVFAQRLVRFCARFTKQHTKVAVGPIMSDWTAFAGGQVDYPYESFGDSSAKPPENSTAVQVDGESGKRGVTST